MDIQQAEYHRNGIGGEGFYVGLFTADDPPGEQMLCIYFPEHDEEGSPLPCGIGPDGPTNPRVAILSVTRLSEVGVTFAQNSWRGDHYTEVANGLVAALDHRYAAL